MKPNRGRFDRLIPFIETLVILAAVGAAIVSLAIPLADFIAGQRLGCHR